jgi:hypothetical protein
MATSAKDTRFAPIRQGREFMGLHKSLKSLSIALWTVLSLWAAPALAAGTIPLAMAQQIDVNGQPIAGCLLNFYVAGTVATLQNNFADFGLTTPQANPLQCDQAGRIPMFWLADGLIHVRLTDASGFQIIDTTMQVLGPSSGGGGGGGTVDPTAILSTGDIKAKYSTGPLAGFVRLNGLTIGNGTSGASERANADTQAAFIYLYGVDPNLVVSGGRSGNALNDFNASKTIATPDWRGRALAALDDMGNSAAGRLTATYFAIATVLGASGGVQFGALNSVNQLPPYTPAGTVPLVNTLSTAPNVAPFPTVNSGAPTTTGLASVPGGGTNLIGGSISASFSGTPVGASAPFALVPPMMLATFYMKL